MFLSGGADAQYKETIAHAFTGGNDGALPYAGLIADAQGNLYGTTGEGGGSGCGESRGCGVVFELTPQGKETVLYAFGGGSDGAYPSAGLIADARGNLYGTTEEGGGACKRGACGTVFEVTPQGQESVLYAFGANGLDPAGGLVADSQGDLYGTTMYSHAQRCRYGCGTIFELTPQDSETVIHAFKGGRGGHWPQAGLTADSQGNLYGAATAGGRGCNLGCGALFKVTPQHAESLLYAFKGGNDGAYPGSALIADAQGNLYGATEEGGGSGCSQNLGCGTIFKVTPDGKETVLYRFAGGSDGAAPAAALVADAQGNFYGTTAEGGGGGCGGIGCGAVFEVTPQGHESVLYAFAGGNDGAEPSAALTFDAQGDLYGTTLVGGSANLGTVFELSKARR
jgi:uncharacterized repeat protein (TIGR03803 family)